MIDQRSGEGNVEDVACGSGVVQCCGAISLSPKAKSTWLQRFPSKECAVTASTGKCIVIVELVNHFDASYLGNILNSALAAC